MTMAMYSVISGRAASNDVAMTGEITLQGIVLPIGGLNEKLLAAKRSGISTVLIPKDNEIDLKEISSKVKEEMRIIPISKIEDAIPYIFSNTKKGRNISKPIAHKKMAKSKWQNH